MTTAKNTTVGSALEYFRDSVEAVMRELQGRWETRAEIDVFHITLDVLYFRNSEIFVSALFLLDQRRLPAAELLLRPMYEGVVIFEWCLLSPQDRALRFRRTSFEGMIQLIEERYIQTAAHTVSMYRDAVSWMKQQGYKPLPNMKQMLEELTTFRQDKAYGLYRILSKLTHAVYENWSDYVCFSEDLKVRRPEQRSQHRIDVCYAMILFLQMRNTLAFGEFDTYMQIPGATELESRWAEIYPILDFFGI